MNVRNCLQQSQTIEMQMTFAVTTIFERIYWNRAMIKLNKAIMFLACAAIVSQSSFAFAQSQEKPAGSATKKEEMSRSFVNGYNVPSTGVAIEGYCPVCYIAANKAAKGDPNFAAEYKGVVYWFVSDDVRKMFAAEPEKYLPAYGGWCATGMAMGQRVPVDPTNFKVVDGKIMLFLKNEKVNTLDIWNKDEAENLKKANATWEKLKG